MDAWERTINGPGALDYTLKGNFYIKLAYATETVFTNKIKTREARCNNGYNSKILKH